MLEPASNPAPRCAPAAVCARRAGALLAGLCLVLAAAAQAPVPDELPMQAVPLAAGEHLRLSGRLDHPAWQRAPAYTRFVEKDPRFGAPPPQRTQVQLLFDAQALYVGITAFDTEPQRIRRQVVRDDGVNRTQDFVVVYLDPIGQRQAAQFFRVNAAGSRADGLHTAADDHEDFAPDFDWDAAVAPHPQGWTAVLRLPFSSLRFASGDALAGAGAGAAAGRDVPWRVMVARRLPRESYHLVTSVPVPREAASFIDTLQPLAGLRLPDHHGFLALRPSVTLRQSHAQAADGSRRREQAVDSSLDLKWRPLAELVVDATLKPDFSQVELDVPQLQGNTRFALSITEKRPFFFESADLLRSPTDAFYTRSFTAPRGGLRATWRGAQLAASVLAVDDRGGGLVLLPGVYGTDVALQPGSRTLAARLRQGAEGLQWGAVLAHRRYEGDRGDNQLLGPDVAWRVDEAWRLRAQWLWSRSTALAGDDGQLQRGRAQDAQRRWLRLQRNSDGWETTLTLDDVQAGYRPDIGFASQAGVRSFKLFQGVGWHGLGPFHEFWLNLTAARTEARQDGRAVEQQLYPGLWLTGAHNLDLWLEWHGLAQQRPSATAPLLAQRYLAGGVVLSPAAWLPLLETEWRLGRLVDTQDERLRPGAQLTVSARLRPLPPLELEPRWSASWLRAEGRRVYDEGLVNLLAVWHLGPRSHVRLIVQRSTLDRVSTAAPAERFLQRETSLTWAWRWSAGTRVYVGASRSREGAGPGPRRNEAFVKLQADLDDMRGWAAGM